MIDLNTPKSSQTCSKLPIYMPHHTIGVIGVGSYRKDAGLNHIDVGISRVTTSSIDLIRSNEIVLGAASYSHLEI